MIGSILGVENFTYTFSPRLQTAYRHWVWPGKYIIIPTTQEPDDCGDFLIRVFSCAALHNANKIPQNCLLSSIIMDDHLLYNGQNYELSFEKTMYGEIKSGDNAGGHINYPTYDKNPQYLITVPNTGSEVPIVVHVLQDHFEPMAVVGMRFYKLDDGDKLPKDYNWFRHNYNDSPYRILTDQPSQYMFVKGWDAEAKWMLPAGRYVAVLHLDSPDDEKGYFFLLKSSAYIHVKDYQTR